ncbi:photosynthetic complex putative assembly protein PuhB [Aurantimonas endophytica]|uniref:YdbS-like PH domain-containing protein n=1 Tax=Aurantimonas endophytica TaxID=1522175 RepID=A0A7W6HB24_9HYPH|nr:photosynthetic complex putative assembly protein PuhB [Aurantimonas endophytica]MBB4001930.1 hypothetical protein [Aurantimonas endophytica]MCO6402437.1 PH domain-containing protein [Aurantimonas endophytica]
MTMAEFDDIRTELKQEELPAGERMLWQGKPDWWRLALGAFQLKAVGVYFLAFALWRFGMTYWETGIALAALNAVLTLLPSLGLGVSLILLLAYLTARATTFTITERRLVLRYGVALPAQLNVPLKDVEAAAVRLYADGSGDIPLTLPDAGRPSYFQLWPYARPWRLGRSEPMLRAVPDAEAVARLLSETLVAAQGGQRVAVAPPPVSARSAPAGHAAAV